jgi:broad specificity phosphatase PhoE
MLFHFLMASDQPLFYFLRHGTTQPNAEGKIISFTDVPLNPVGQEQALAAKAIIDALAIDTIYCSPLRRALETTDIVNRSKQITVTSVPELTEQNLGTWELQTVPFFLERYKGGKGESPEGGEKNDVFYQRIKAVIDARATSKARPVLFVGHYGFFYALQNAFNLQTRVEQFKNCMVMAVFGSHQDGWHGKEISIDDLIESFISKGASDKIRSTIASLSDILKETTVDTEQNKIHVQLGKLYFALGQNQEARISLEKVNPANPKFLEGQAYLGAVYDELSLHEEAQKILEECVKAYGEKTADNQDKLAFVRMHLGKTLSQRGKYTDSERELMVSIDLYTQSTEEQKENLVKAKTLLAETHMYSGKYQESEGQFLAAIQACGNDQKLMAWTNLRLGRFYSFRGNYPKAQALFQDNIPKLKQYFPHDPDKLGWNLFYLGDVYRSLRLFDQATKTMTEGFEAFKACGYTADHQITQWGQGYYGRLLCDRGEHAQAQPILEESLRVHEVKYGANSKRNGFIMQALANAYAHTGVFKGADSLFKDTLAVYEKQFGKEHTEYAFVLRDYGRLAFLQKDFPTAIERLEKALSVLKTTGHSEVDRCNTYLEEAKADSAA